MRGFALLVGHAGLLLTLLNGVPLLSASNEVQKLNLNLFQGLSELRSSYRYKLSLRGQFFPIGSKFSTTTDMPSNTTTTDSPTTTVDSNNNNTVSQDLAATILFRPNDTTTSLSPLATDEKISSDPASSIEKISFVAWPLRRRPASRKFRPLVPLSTKRPPLIKLIRPRPTRPAMYSLDGFVPRPSLKKIFTSTTKTPALDGPFKGKFDLQALDSVQKKRKIKFRNEVGVKQEEKKKKFGTREQHRKKRPITRNNLYSRKGVAGKDYPVYGSVPKTGFDCAGKSGMKADPKARCQVWHLCPGNGTPHRHSFLCPNGTVFSESKGVCDWWYNVDCPQAA